MHTFTGSLHVCLQLKERQLEPPRKSKFQTTFASSTSWSYDVPALVSVELFLGKQNKQECGGEDNSYSSAVGKEGPRLFALKDFLLEILILPVLIFQWSCWTAGTVAR